MQIKFIINSHIEYVNKTIHKIIPSLLQSGIDPSLIYMIVTQCNENKKIENQYGINLYQVDHNSYDAHATFLSVFELGLSSDYWFYIHDTCIVEEKFYQKIKEFDYSPDYDVVRLCNENATMGLALYKHSYIKKFEPTLRKEKNTDYSEERMKIMKRDFSIMRENMFIWKSKIKHYIGDIPIDVNNIKISSFSNPEDKYPKYLGICDFYGTGTPRLKVHFEDIGIYKFSANYGQNPHESFDHVIKL